MFTYIEKTQIDIEIEKSDYKTYLKLHAINQGTYGLLMNASMYIYHAYLIQDKENRNKILSLASDILSDTEIINSLLILLKGNDIRYIDVCNTNALDYEAITTNHKTDNTSFMPVNDFTFFILHALENENRTKKEYLNLYNAIQDKKIKEILSYLIYQSKKRIQTLRILIIKDNTHHQNSFKNAYEFENIWDYDSGNYFDPPSPIFINEEKE